mmetsp:Transcript_60393/g.171673  ORF Transcript_60393/g.171673 Transcript_60393/m.171673 type:complete len:228 (+) Transcript_60393:313-996(+)
MLHIVPAASDQRRRDGSWAAPEAAQLPVSGQPAQQHVLLLGPPSPTSRNEAQVALTAEGAANALAQLGEREVTAGKSAVPHARVGPVARTLRVLLARERAIDVEQAKAARLLLLGLQGLRRGRVRRRLAGHGAVAIVAQVEVGLKVLERGAGVDPYVPGIVLVYTLRHCPHHPSVTTLTGNRSVATPHHDLRLDCCRSQPTRPPFVQHVHGQRRQGQAQGRGRQGRY